MLMAPTSDVPASAAWAVSVACALGRTPGSAIVAGAAAAVAILIRPNIAPLAGVIVVWIAFRNQAAFASASARKRSLEPQEIDELLARWRPTRMSARLDWTPMVSFRDGAVRMYDGVGRERQGTAAQPPARVFRDCPSQKSAPPLREGIR